MANRKAQSAASRFFPAIGLLLTAGVGLGLIGAAAIAAADMWDRHKSTATLDWESLRANIAALDVLLNLSSNPDELVSIIKSRAMAGNDTGTANVAVLIKNQVTPYIVRSKFSYSLAGSNGRFQSLCTEIWTYVADFDNISLYDLITRNMILDAVEVLFYLREYIDTKDRSEKKEIVRELLENSLQKAFDEVAYPESKRPALLDKVADILVNFDQEIEIADQEIALPSEAPVKWRDREPGETAPDFARRVYGQWLKDGMSKRALRGLDAALLNELNKWVRDGNDIPPDINLLTISEENRRLLDAGPEAMREHLGKFTGAEAAREAERLRVAQVRSRNS